MIDTALSFLCLCLARGRRSWLQLHFPNRCQRMKIASPSTRGSFPRYFCQQSIRSPCSFRRSTWKNTYTKTPVPAYSRPPHRYAKNNYSYLARIRHPFAVLDRRAACCSASLPSPGSRGSCEVANKGGHGHHGESLELFAHHQMLAL